MINLLIYINPEGFDEESKKLIKIQIDNSLELGWTIKDILLVTNFEHEYRGVKALVIDNSFCSFWKEASKIYAILRLFDLRLIKNDLYWFHDLDAYQLEAITEEELGLEGLDAGFTDYGRKPSWNTGSFFFKNSSEDIFREIYKRLKPGLNKEGRIQHEEQALMEMTAENTINVNQRIKRLNHTYNFGMRKVKLCYQTAIKPLKVLHFHPFHPRNKGLDTLAISMYGKNELGFPLMNERLIKIFNNYGYR